MKLASILVAATLTLLGTGSARADDVALPCESEPTDMTIHVGDIVQCDISPAGDTDLYRFDGNAGDRILLTLIDQSCCGPSALGQVFGPDQQQFLTMTADDGSDTEVIDLPTTGTYTLLVRDNGDNQAMSYTVALQRLVPLPPETETLCYDCVMDAKAIEIPGDTDVYQFAGTAGDTVVVTLTDRSCCGPSGAALVYGPDHQLITTILADDGGTAQVIGLVASGAYTVLVRDQGDNQAMTYNLALQRLTPPPDATICIEYGAPPIDYTISPVADSDIFQFAGAAGSNIILTLTDFSCCGPSVIAEVFGPGGVLVKTIFADDGSATWEPQLTTSGIYKVYVRDNGDNHELTYGIALQCVFGTCPTCATPVRRSTWGQLKALYR